MKVKNLIKRTLSVVITIALLLTLCNAYITTVNAVDTQTGPTITAEKTAAWTNTAKTTADINIQAKSDDTNSKAKNVLLLGTLCDGHGMGSSTLKNTINTIAKKMNVKYYAIYAGKQFNSSKITVYSESLTKGGSVSKDFSLDAPKHYAAKTFIDTLYTELITNEATYDYLLFEYDSSRIAIKLQSELDDMSSSNAAAAKADLVTKMDELAPVLAKYYADHKVVWITDSNMTYSFSKAEPSNRTDQGNGTFGLDKFDFKVLTCIVSPSEYDSFDTTYASYDDDKTYKLKDIDSYPSDVSYESKISYADVAKLNEFIKKRLLSQRNEVVIKDTVVDDMEITGTKVQTSADGNTWSNYTVSSPSSVVVSQDKKSVTATIKDIIFEIGTIQYVRLVVSVKDTGRFKVSTDKSVTSRDPNKGAADVSVTPLGLNKTELKPTTKVPLSWADQSIYELKTIVRGGTTPNAAFYAAKGESPISETSPSNTAYELVYVKINNVSLTGTDKTNYNSTHKYTATNISKDTTVRVCYGTKVKGTYPPVKTNETTPDKKSDDMYTNTDIKVILNGGKWTAPANLTKTATDGVYTIAGSYDMGNATKDGNVFLGWKVEDDINEADDIVKIYTAIFEEDKIGDIVTDPTKDQKDGIPDKYQKLITFKVVNGTWDGTANNNGDKKQYITLKDDSGNWSVNGKATVVAPSGMTANYGYEKGTWATSNPTVTSGSNLTLTKSTDTTFTHSFSKIADKEIEFKKPNTTTPGSTKIPYGKKIRINPNGGSVVIGTKKTATFEVVIEDDLTIPDATPMEGYSFVGWEEIFLTGGDVICVYTAQYKANPVESQYQPEQKDDKKPDKITDNTSVKYDDKIKVVLNGGTWTAPSTLNTTSTTGVYTVKGNYDMGEPTIDGYVFLGWNVTDGTDGIVKVYTATYKAKAVENKYKDAPSGDEIVDKEGVKFDDKVKVVLNGGTWVGAPKALVETNEKGIYVVKGDYDMSYATLDGSEFLGWEVTEGADGVTKVYSAKFKAISPVTGYNSALIYACIFASFAACLYFGVMLLLKKKSNACE